MSSSEILIYNAPDGRPDIQVKLDGDTIWLSQRQMSELFEKDTDTIGLHLKNIFKSGELDENSTTEESSVVQLEGNRKVKRRVKLYNLDAIISLGYRVNSLRGTQFRIWANKVLREYLVNGYSLNKQVLEKKKEQFKELQETIGIIRSSLGSIELTGEESKGLLKIISDYSYALEILDQYDYQKLAVSDTTTGEPFRLTYKEAIEQIKIAKQAYGNSELFGREKDDSFQSSIGAVYQTFDGKDLYPSVEEKAANLLYFVTKNHSFTDGNKRIAAFLFLYFLDKNGILYTESGQKRITDNALVALTLMIAVSKPEEKDTMIKVMVSLINKNN